MVVKRVTSGYPGTYPRMTIATRFATQVPQSITVYSWSFERWSWTRLKTSVQNAKRKQDNRDSPTDQPTDGISPTSPRPHFYSASGRHPKRPTCPISYTEWMLTSAAKPEVPTKLVVRARATSRAYNIPGTLGKPTSWCTSANVFILLYAAKPNEHINS